MCNQQSRSSSAMPAAVMACAALVFAFAGPIGAGLVAVWQALVVVGAVVLTVGAAAGVARFVAVPVLRARHSHRPIAWPVPGRRRVEVRQSAAGHPALPPAADSTTTTVAQARGAVRRG